jgi:hypothetical protein
MHVTTSSYINANAAPQSKKHCTVSMYRIVGDCALYRRWRFIVIYRRLIVTKDEQVGNGVGLRTVKR